MDDDRYRELYGEDPPRCRRGPREPLSSGEWRFCVDSAQFLLACASARAYGLIKGGPPIDVDRAQDLLARGRKLGYQPRDLTALCDDFIADWTAA